MQTKEQAIQTKAVIAYCEARDCFTVAVGMTRPHYGSLFSCEQWCRDRGIPVRNQDELNRIKYGNMPIHEMFCQDHIQV